MGISERIISIRKAKGITQTFIAERLDMDRGNYSKLEKRGVKMTVEQLQSIAEALGVSLGEVLGVEGKEKEGNRVKELEELVELQRDRFNKLMFNLLFLQNSFLTHIRHYMVYTAFEEGIFNEKNTEGYFKVERHESGRVKEILYDELLDEKYEVYTDFIISDLLTEKQLIHLIELLSDELMSALTFMFNADLIDDKKLKSAYSKFATRMMGDKSKFPNWI